MAFTRTCRRSLCLAMVFIMVGTALVRSDSTAEPNSQKQNGTQPSTSVSSNDDRTVTDKGMDVLYDMTKGFLHTVQPNHIYDQDWLNLTQVVKDHDVTESLKKWQNWAKYLIGFTVCIAFGILFFIVMPIAGIIFCCCRCCGRCGGKKKVYDPKRANCKRKTFLAVLLVLNTIMLAGVVCAFVTNDLIHRHLQNEDNKGPVGKVSSALMGLRTFVDGTVKEVRDLGITTFNRTSTELILDIDSTADTAVDDVANSLNATFLLNKAENLANEVNDTKKNLHEVTSSLEILSNLGKNLTDELAKIKTELQSLCKQGKCNVTVNDYDTDANFTGLDRLASETSKVGQTLNMKNSVEDARAKIDDVKNTSAAEIRKQINDASSSISNVRKDIEKEMDKFEEKIKTATQFIDDGIRDMNEKNTDVKKYSDYVWYAGIGLCCTILLIIVLYYLGALFGMCGERPGDDAPCCNKGNGANFLMSGVVFSFLFSWILILIIIILFAVGGPAYTEVCRYFVDHNPDELKPFSSAMMDGLDLSKKLFKDKEVDLNIATVLNDCEKDMPVYSVLQLDNLVNLSQVLNKSIVNEKLDEIKNKKINVKNITLVSAELRGQMKNFSNSGIDDIDFNKYYQQLDKTSKKLTKANLTVLAEELDTAAGKTTPSPLANNLTIFADRLRYLQKHNVEPMEKEIPKLKSSLKSLEKHKVIKNDTDDLLSGLEKAQNNFNLNGTDLVNQMVKNISENLKKKVDDKFNEVIYKVKTNVGKCKPLFSNVYALTDSLCVVMLNPVNGLWFSLGWCIFFFIPLIIFALLLVSLYRREEEYDPSKEFDDPNFSMYAGSDPDTIPLTRVNNQNGVHGGANYPGVANSGYHREDQFAGKAPPYNYSGYREPIDQFQNNDMYYRGSKEPPPPAYSGGGHQVYPSDYELDLYQGHHSKSPKYPVQY